MTNPACGIDFGTSNSTVGLADPDGVRLIPLEGKDVTLPSAVFWDASGDPPEFGRAALAAYTGGEDGRLMRGLKSTLGSSLINERTRVGAKSLTFRQILAAFIAHLKTRLDQTTGGTDRVILGRPVHFVDDDAAGDAAAQTVLEEIARASGFREVGFQFEPIAAALDYEAGVTAEELVLIVDIGGGTSDVSVVRVSPDRARHADRAADILGNDGIRLGGTDFDRLLSLTEVMPHLGLNSTTGDGKAFMPRHYYLDLSTWHRIHALNAPRTLSDLKALRHEADRPELIDRLMRVIDNRLGHALAIEVESAKIALSDAPTARLNLRPLTGGPNPVAGREAFEAAAAAAVLRLDGLLRTVLAQAGRRPDQIATVFMTGGSSSLPMLRACVANLLPGARIATGDMFGSVGTGLALDAMRRFR